MIVCKLSRVMGDKRWNQKQLAKATGIRPNAINALYHGYAKRISLEHLEKICKALDCKLGDIIVEIPDGEEKTIKDLPKRDAGKKSKTS